MQLIYKEPFKAFQKFTNNNMNFVYIPNIRIKMIVIVTFIKIK